MSTLWERYRQFLVRHDSLGFSVDVSRMRFADDFFTKMEPMAQRAFSERAGLSPAEATSLVLITEEWLNNIIEHGAAAPTARIILRFRRAPGLVRLTVSDAGRSFDPRRAVFDGPNTSRGGGAGLALIQAWCRIADYRRQRGRNHLVFEMAVP